MHTKNLKSDKKSMSNNIAWMLVILGGIIECFWVSGLKYADSFLLYVLTGLGILCSFCCAIIAMKRLEVSICYAVFVGIGSAGVVLSEMIFFGEAFSLAKIVLIFLLLVGVVGLKIVSADGDPSASSAAVDSIRQDLGLDEISDRLGDVHSASIDASAMHNYAQSSELESSHASTLDTSISSKRGAQ